MVVLHHVIVISNVISITSHLHSNQRNGGRPKSFIVSKREELNERKLEKTQEDVKRASFPIKKILAQVGIGVVTLGFIDAGYSGDWSRIGVISTENEDMLKTASYLVVPICVYLIYVISQEPEES